MDFSRAKTILIVAFLLLNLLLVWESFEKRSGMVIDEVDPIYTVQLGDLLRQQEVRLEAEIPTEVPRAALLTAHFQAPVMPKEQGQVQLVEHQPNLWEVRLSSVYPLLGEERRSGTPGVLAEQIGHFEVYQPDPLLSSEEVWRYVQLWEGVPLFNGTLEVRLESGGVTSYLQAYAEVQTSGEEQNLISAVSAVNSLLENGVIPSGATLLEVRFGYYGRLHDSEEQVLSPVWRVVYAGADARTASMGGSGLKWVYVNAITGSVDSGQEAQMSEQ